MSYSPPGLTLPRTTPIIIETNSLESIGVELRAMSGQQPANSNYPGVNSAIFVPFGIAEPLVVVKMWVQNGTAVAGNIDLGIYNPDGSRVVSKGSTAQAGISTIQELDITDTTLQPGRYYMAINSDTSGVSQKVLATAIPVAGMASAMGVYQAALGSVTLPDPVTFATFATGLLIPAFGLSARTLVV